MARALLVKPTRIDGERMLGLLEGTGLEVEVVGSLDPARLVSDAPPALDLLFMDAPPGNPEPLLRPSRMEWVLVPPEADPISESFCREWGCWLLEDPFQRETLLRKVIRTALELVNLRRALGEEASIHAVDDLWFPILDRLRRRLN